MIKVEDGYFVKTEVTENMVDKEEELFLCGRKMLTEWKTVLFFEEIDYNLKKLRRG